MTSNGVMRFLPILAVQFVGSLGFSIALPILVFLVRDLGGAAWTYGVVGATYSTFQLVGAPLLGRWSDRVGRRPVLMISLAGTLVGWLLFLFALSLPKAEVARFAGAVLTWPLLLVFLARAVDGLTGGNVSVASAYVADLTVGETTTRSKAFGWMGIAGSLGFTLGPLISGTLSATSLGFKAPILAAGLISALAIALSATLREPISRCPEGPPPQPTVEKLLGQQQRRCDRRPEPIDRMLRASPDVRRLLVATFVLFLAFNFFYVTFPVDASARLGWSPSRMGALYSALSILLMVSQGPVLAFAAKRVGPRALFAAGMLILALGFASFTRESAVVIFAGAALFALGNGLSWPTFQARVADAAGPEAQGVVQGAAASASSLASIVGLILGGMLYAWLGSWLFLAGSASFVALAVAAGALFGGTRAPESPLR
jgi:MFS family permease